MAAGINEQADWGENHQAMLEREKMKAERETQPEFGVDRQPPVIEKLDLLGEGLAFLEDMVNVLERKFDPVIRKEFEAKSDVGPNEKAALDTRGEVHQRLHAYNNRLSEQIMRIRDIIDRAEV